jgi:hypothetical protein
VRGKPVTLLSRLHELRGNGIKTFMSSPPSKRGTILLIGVAHPDFRTELESLAEKYGLRQTGARE